MSLTKWQFLLTHITGRAMASHRRGPVSIPDQSVWDLWWTEWHWDRFFPEYFGFPLSVSFNRCSITWKTKNKPSSSSHRRVAQEALMLRCVRSVCFGALLHTKKHMICKTYIPALLDRWIPNTPSVKIRCPKICFSYFRKNMTWLSGGLLRICQVFSVSYKIVYRRVTTSDRFMSDTYVHIYIHTNVCTVAALTYRWEQHRRNSVNESEIGMAVGVRTNEPDLLHSSAIGENGTNWKN
jgi:hypothetical protein